MAFEEEFSRIMVEREMQEALLGGDDGEQQEGGEEEVEGYREDRRRLTPLLLESRRDDGGPSWRRETEPNVNIPMAAVVPVADVAVDSSSKTRMAVQVDPSENDVRQGEIQHGDGSSTMMVGVKKSRRFYCTIQ